MKCAGACGPRGPVIVSFRLTELLIAAGTHEKDCSQTAGSAIQGDESIQSCGGGLEEIKKVVQNWHRGGISHSGQESSQYGVSTTGF